MHFSAVLFCTAAIALPDIVLASEPCALRPVGPQHVSAFVIRTASGADLHPFVPSAFGNRIAELDLQADCLAWEYTVSPRAEFIGTAPLGKPLLSAGPRSEEGLLVIPGSSSGQLALPSSTPPSNHLFDLAQKRRSFTFGATLQAAP